MKVFKGSDFQGVRVLESRAATRCDGCKDLVRLRPPKPARLPLCTRASHRNGRQPSTGGSRDFEMRRPNGSLATHRCVGAAAPCRATREQSDRHVSIAWRLRALPGDPSRRGSAHRVPRARVCAHVQPRAPARDIARHCRRVATHPVHRSSLCAVLQRALRPNRYAVGRAIQVLRGRHDELLPGVQSLHRPQPGSRLHGRVAIGLSVVQSSLPRRGYPRPNPCASSHLRSARRNAGRSAAFVRRTLRARTARREPRGDSRRCPGWVGRRSRAFSP